MRRILSFGILTDGDTRTGWRAPLGFTGTSITVCDDFKTARHCPTSFAASLCCAGQGPRRHRDGRHADLIRSLVFLVGPVLVAVPATAQVMPHNPPEAVAGPAASPLTPIPIGSGITLKPIIDARLRWEHVDQDGLNHNADAVTARVRAGIEATTRSGFAVLVESEATLAIDPNYNSATNGKTSFPIVPDPQNIELNRAQLQYRGLKGWTFTAGRQVINIDDQRFVGSVAWRQNEQTFDAVRVEAKQIGPFTADVAYAWSDRTLYGITAQGLPPTSTVKQAIGGNNVFASSGVKLGLVTVKAFTYLVDQDEPGRRIFSSQTYGARANASVPLGPIKLKLVGSYARQSDYASNPSRYAASYWTAEGGTSIVGFGTTIGYEVLGADRGLANTSFQTPLATLHKFNGFADKFLVTPPNGLQDLYATLGRSFPGMHAMPGLTAAVTYHRFRSDRLELHYGDEWDAQLGFKFHGVGILAKYAAYNADSFATNTKKFWLQTEWTI